MTPDDREARLPKWAQELIKDLRHKTERLQQRLDLSEQRWERDNTELAELTEIVRRCVQSGRLNRAEEYLKQKFGDSTEGD